MAFCAQCGAEGQGNFCPACGAPRTSTAAPSTVATAGTTQLDDNIVAALCYLLWPLTGVLFLVLEPYNRSRDLRFHAYQSILTFCAVFAGFMCLSFMAYLPLINLLMLLFMPLYGAAGIVLWLVLIYKAYSKERWVLPVIGELAEKQS
jgi:uncharacterized membrane protein